jgi:ribosomal protein S27E
MYDYDEKPRKKPMDSKNKHPFAITCRKCGGNDVTVIAYEHQDLGIRCNSCRASIRCGTYHTMRGDYSDM